MSEMDTLDGSGTLYVEDYLQMEDEEEDEEEEDVLFEAKTYYIIV